MDEEVMRNETAAALNMVESAETLLVRYSGLSRGFCNCVLIRVLVEVLPSSTLMSYLLEISRCLEKA